jgi:hypothetical protein
MKKWVIFLSNKNNTAMNKRNGMTSSRRRNEVTSSRRRNEVTSSRPRNEIIMIFSTFNKIISSIALIQINPGLTKPRVNSNDLKSSTSASTPKHPSYEVIIRFYSHSFNLQTHYIIISTRLLFPLIPQTLF